MEDTDILYLGRSPFDVSDDFGITWDNMQQSITKVDTLTAGTWEATLIAPEFGGTGKSNDGMLETAGTNTYLFPDVAAGTVCINNGGGLKNITPKYSVYLGIVPQSIPWGVFTKLNLGAVFFDTNECYDPLTYRFVPTVPGYYQINAGCLIEFLNGDSNCSIVLSIYKNGGQFSNGTSWSTVVPGPWAPGVNLSDIVPMNGTTDYIEVYVYHNQPGSRNAIDGTSGVYTYVSGTLLP